MQQATQEPCSGLFRSEDMQLISIAFERGRVKKDMLALGELGCMQFCDLNNERQAFAKEFTSDIRRCEDLQRKLRYFQGELHRWAPGGGWRVPAASPKQEVPAIEDMEEAIGNVYPELQKQTQHYDQMKEKWMKCYESCQVHWAPGVVNFCGSESREDGVLGVLAGTIPSSKVRTMERLVYRSTKGNVTSHFSELVHPAASDYKLSDAASLYAASDFDRHVFFFVFTSQSIRTRLKRLALSMEVCTHTLSLYSLTPSLPPTGPHRHGEPALCGEQGGGGQAPGSRAERLHHHACGMTNKHCLISIDPPSYPHPLPVVTSLSPRYRRQENRRASCFRCRWLPTC